MADAVGSHDAREPALIPTNSSRLCGLRKPIRRPTESRQGSAVSDARRGSGIACPPCSWPDVFVWNNADDDRWKRAFAWRARRQGRIREQGEEIPRCGPLRQMNARTLATALGRVPGRWNHFAAVMQSPGSDPEDATAIPRAFPYAAGLATAVEHERSVRRFHDERLLLGPAAEIGDPVVEAANRFLERSVPDVDQVDKRQGQDSVP